MQESGKWASDLEGRGALCMCSKSPNVGSWDRFMGHGRHATENTWLVLKYWPGEDRGMLQTEDQTDATAPRWKQAKQDSHRGLRVSRAQHLGWGSEAAPGIGPCTYSTRPGLSVLQGMRTSEGSRRRTWVPICSLGELGVKPGARPGIVCSLPRSKWCIPGRGSRKKKKKRQENDFWPTLKTNIYWDLEPEVIKVVLKLHASQKVWGEMQVLFFFVDVINFRVLKHVQ